MDLVPDIVADTAADVAAETAAIVVENAAQSATTVAVEFVVEMIAAAVAAITEALSQAIASDTGPTAVNLSSAVFSTGPAAQLAAICGLIGGALLIGFHMLAVARAALTGDVGGIVRTSLVEVPKAIFKAAIATAVAQLAISIVDATSRAFIGAEGETLAAFSNTLADTEVLTATGLLGLVFAVLYIVGSIIIWFQLLARAALIYLIIAFSPIAFAVGVTGTGRQMETKVVMVAIALIVSKLAQVGALALGAAFLADGSPDGGSVSSMMLGSALMLMAAFTPWLIHGALPTADAANPAVGAGTVAAGTAMAGTAVAGRTAVAATRTAAGAAGSGSQATATRSTSP